MLNSEIIKNNIFKYDFFSKFAYGKIFDHQSNTFTTYNSAKILLEKGSNEIYSCSNFNEINLRKFDDKNNIIYYNITNANFESFFDCVISFENFNKNEFSENLKTYFKFLKKNGTLIISIFNKQNNGLEENNKISIAEIREKLSSKFKIIEIYSQRFLEKSNKNQKKNILSISRTKLANILKKIDKNRQFYIKYFQKNISKLDSFNENIRKIPDEDYIPKKYDERDQPYILIFICKKY